MTLTTVESSHLAAWGYEFRDFILTIQFRNADIYEYSNVPEEIINGLKETNSIGSFFSTLIRPCFDSVKIHAGTLSERAEIWMRSKDAAEFRGNAVALQKGNPVSVCAWVESEKIADLRALYDGDETVVIVEVPNAAS